MKRLDRILLQGGNLSRIDRRVGSAVSRVRHRLGLRVLPQIEVSISSEFRHPIDLRCRERLIETYRTRFPAAAAAEIAEARRLAAHRFRLLNQAFEFGDTIAWSRDPVSGRDWPSRYAEDIPYRGAARLGDIKLPWELNKHQYFFTLGKASWLTGDGALASEIVRQIVQWIDGNPCGIGINWISALECGTRIVSWLLAYPFFVEHIDAASERRIAESLAEHCLFVEQRLSVGPFANTHLVGEAVALLAAGLFLQCRHSRRWVDKGLAILVQEARRQSTRDGAHVERSVAYHRFFVDQYYLAAALLAANDRVLPDDTLAVVERMTEYVMAVLFPDGTAPAFGDDDDARGIWLHADAPSDYRGLLALGSVLFGRGDFKFGSNGITEDVLWLFGLAGVATFDRLQSRPPLQLSAAFPDAGYFVMRGGWQQSDSVLVFDCGPIGFGPAGHGHADALSIQLHAGDYTFLTDPGAYSYNLDYAWRDAFRTTRAHNTIAVDDEPQSIPADRMSWTRMAHAAARAWVSTPWFDLVEGEHDGYQRLQDPVRHRRVVTCIKPGVWIVVDTLTAAGEHSYELLWHLRPDADVSASPDRPEAIIASPAGQRLHVRVSSEGTVLPPFAVLRGTDGERAAWFSPGYASRVPTQTLSVKKSVSGTLVLITEMTLGPQNVTAAAYGSDGFHARAGARQFSWSREPRTVEFPGVRFHGQLLFQHGTSLTTTVARAERFTELALTGVLDVRATRPIAALTYEAHRRKVSIESVDPADVHVAAHQKIDIDLIGVA